VKGQLDPDLRLTAVTFTARLRTIKEAYVGRDEAVDVVALATLCREHALLIGPPGTAKTALLERFASMLHARYFTYLLTRFTEPAELFGAIDVRSFQQDSVYRVNTDGMLPTAQIAFLDEIFHGSSAILNTLLTLINERVFHNGSVVDRAALISLLGAANEMPDDPLLLAFCDRFLFRCRLDYVADDMIEDVLQLGWHNEQELIRAGGPTEVDDAAGFSLADLAHLQTAVADVDLTAVESHLTKVLRAFREEAIAFSDRRAVKALKAVAASALLDGRGRAEPADLAVLVNLWTSPQDESSIRYVLESHDVPLSRAGHASRSPEEINYLLREIERQLPDLASREECREALRRLGTLLAELRAGHPGEADMLRAVQHTQSQLLTMLRDQFNEDGEFDV
jgi:MoxR-like ATPase